MPDWRQLIRERLGGFKLCAPAFSEQVIDELAGHLEDRYRERVRTGLLEETALQQTLHELELARKKGLALRLLKEHTMTGSTRKIALPGLLTCVVSMAIAWTLDAFHIPPKIVFFRDPLFLSVPIAWMCTLPICGALGAIVSRRCGGSRLDRMISASFPAALFAVVFVFLFVAGCVISLFVRDYWQWPFVAWGIVLWGTGYVILPAIPLLLGAAIAEKAGRTSAKLA